MLSRWPEETLQKHLKASLKDFDIPMGSWEQIARAIKVARSHQTKRQLSMKKR